MSTMLQSPRPSLEPGATPPLPGEPHSEGQARKFRPDIEGLRALAVLAVVLYHAHLLGITGGYVGVDIFFVLSGFLITRQLVAGIDKRGIREIPSFYGRRIKRLLPASGTVVVATVLASYVWLPVLQVKSITVDAIFTTFYGLNYRLAYNGTDYLHQGSAVSPLQHFWSLGVEEQFYVVWPVLIVLALLLPLQIRFYALMALLTGIATFSFYLSAATTVESPSWAYFGLQTRAWELAVGGIIALTAPLWTRLPRKISNPLAWFAIASIVASCWVLTDKTVYPGTAAAWPVLATCVILACGCAPRHHSIERLLVEPAIQGIGKISYSWYLWHWPVLVIFPFIAGEALKWPRRLEVVVLSLGFAIISYHLVENPVRKMKKLNFEWVRLAVALAGVVIAVSVIASNTIDTTGTGLIAQAATINVQTPGASQRLSSLLTDSAAIQKAPRNLTPEPAVAINDIAVNSKQGCLDNFTQIKQPACLYGDLKAMRTAVLFGDSHMDQYSAGLIKAATSMHWRLLILTKSACPAADLDVYAPALKREYAECQTWRALTTTRIINARPTLVILSQSDDVVGPDTSASLWANTTAATVKRFRDAGLPVTFLLDTPFHGTMDVPSCVSDHLNDVRPCVLQRSKAYTTPQRRADVAKAVSALGATVVDPVNWFCGPQLCPAITGNLLIWRDTGHMTATYSRYLAPLLGPALLTIPSSEGAAKQAGTGD